MSGTPAALIGANVGPGVPATISTGLAGPSSEGRASTEEQRLAEKARMYDSAFQRSGATTTAKRRSSAGSASGGTLQPLAQIAQAQTQSQPSRGERGWISPRFLTPARPTVVQQQALDEEDLQEEGYVVGEAGGRGGRFDDGESAGPGDDFIERDDEDELADGGVMGLLTQIYDNRRRGI